MESETRPNQTNKPPDKKIIEQPDCSTNKHSH